MISVSHLTKSYGTHCVLKDISFDVTPGEIICLLGASGGGKTTLLRCLNYLESFDAGTVKIDDVVLTPQLPQEELKRRVFEIRKRVGMVFQQFNLFPHKTVLDNIIEAPTQVLKQNIADAKRKALTLLEQVGMSAKAERYPSRLSGGEQQRIAIARALAMDPELILFDEPTSALDPERVGEIVTLLKNLAQNNITMIIVSHSIGFVNAIADRVFFMADGEILESGPPSSVLHNPSNERTKKFMRQELLLE